MKKKLLLSIIPLFLALSIPQTSLAQSEPCLSFGALCKNAAGRTLGNCCSGLTCTNTIASGDTLCEVDPQSSQTSPQITLPKITLPKVGGGSGGGGGGSGVHGTCGEDYIDTAIGCIPYGDTNKFIAFILKWAIGVGGGIAFILILVGGFQIITSSGNPERLKAGRELLTSALAGLILLVFSVFILRIIGVDILGIL